MNFKRGLLSSWVVICCAWAIIHVIAIASTWSPGNVDGPWSRIGLAIIPPAIAFGVGASIAWAISGFGLD